MKKALLTVFLCVSLSLTGLTACAAENTANKDITIVLQIRNPDMTVNGTQKPIDDSGTVPVIENNRTLLPIRAIIEELGGNVEWDGDTQTVLLAYNDDIVTLAINSRTAFLNSDKSELDTAPMIINNRTMLPIRFIAESFKFNVDWQQDEQKITITNTN